MNTSTQTEPRMRQLRFAPFALAIICFALPFVTVSCQGQKVASFTGVELVTGSKIEQRDSFSGQVQTKKTDSEPRFVVALVCAAAAAALCFLSGAAGKALPAIMGVASLILLFLGKSTIEADAVKAAQGAMTCAWEIGFIAACVLLLAGVIAAGFQLAQKSAGAPQPPQTAESAPGS